MSKTIAAIGVFDGVHKGHARIILAAARQARKEGLRPIVITFDPHPCAVLLGAKAAPSIISTAHRLRLIRRLGIRKCEVIRFSKKFASMAPRVFARDILMKRFNVRKVYVGKNFVFGKSNSGNSDVLKGLGKELGFGVGIVPLARAGGRVISSTTIREMIGRGDLGGARSMLGRPVSVSGTVVSGKKRGRLLGFPTANIDPHHEVIPPSGVYAVKVALKDARRYGGALFIGSPQTFGEEEPVVEVHIFGFHRFIYNEPIEVEFVKRLRANRKFRSREALVGQIRRDDKRAREILGVKGNNALQ
jgi:riboflavin kinase/FMN adenylyltransferase